MNATCYNSLESNPQVGIFSLDLYLLVLNDINIENLYIRHIMIILREKICALAGIRTQISSFRTGALTT